MKQLFLLATVFLALFACNSAATKKPTTFKIEISELRSFLNGDGKWTITQDSIVCIQTKLDRISDTTVKDTFSRALSKFEMESIAKLLSKIDLNKFENSYIDHSAVDDMNEYEFTISMNEQSKTFRVYMVKIEEIFNLVKQINELFPEQHKIGYDDIYFR